MKIVITGGAGYIGSHTAVEALRAGHEVIIVDSLANSSEESLERIEKASGRTPIFHKCSLTDHPWKIYDALGKDAYRADAIIHFAAYKCSPDSVSNPLGYYRNNIESLITAIRLCELLSIDNFIFSSSATVYGDPQFLPITEEHPIGKGTTPYGSTKITGEWIVEDSTRVKRMRSLSLRYFNPAGADISGEIGESPIGRPNNLVPIITQTAAGILPILTVTGTDFPTPDGSAIRDYIHVTDLAHAHLASLEWLLKQDLNTYEVFNIGTGRGTSVIEMVKAFSAIQPKSLIYKKGERRTGDPAEVWCDPSKAERVLGWKAKFDISDILRSAWKWERKLRGLDI